MSRVTVHRNLPPLAKMLEHFSSFPGGKSHQQVVIEELRGVAEKLNSTVSQPFYSMREVADFFRVPLGTISRVYKRLEREGVVSRIRSSHTMLVGKEVLPREAVRGVVGLYVWLHSMVLLAYTQTLVIEFEEHLRRLGYVADIIFHSAKNEETEPDFVTRLLQHRLDAVVFHTPQAASRQNILSLRDRGVRVLVVQRKDTQFDLPALIYLQDYQTAYQKMAARWHQIGIRKVWLCTPAGYLHYKAETNIFKSILNKHDLETESVLDEPRLLLKKIRQRTAKMSTALAFLDGTQSELFCNRHTQVIEQISRVARLAFCVGLPRLPCLQFRNIRVDIVDFSPSEVAAKLADDVGRLSVLSDGIHHTFVAHYQEQIPL
jgi:hypothetical protein